MASDDFDYSMSDLFVAETVPRPYRVGFRSRRHPRRPSLAYINSLCDRDFAAYCRNGCRLPSDHSDVGAEIDALRAEVRELRNAVHALRQAMVRTTSDSPSVHGGLNVPPRA
jgi:hypothetical protein